MEGETLETSKRKIFLKMLVSNVKRISHSMYTQEEWKHPEAWAVSFYIVSNSLTGHEV